MSTATSHPGRVVLRAARHWGPWMGALEVLLVYAAILLYIWRWQFTYPGSWMILLALVLASFIFHRDSAADRGLTFHYLRSSAGAVLRLAAAVYVPLVIVGLATRRLDIVAPQKQTFAAFAAYAAWCTFQQFLTQSYFHRRLMSFVPNPHGRAALVGLMFGGAHIPNPVLVVVTALGGFVMAEVFARHRNIWPLGLAQAVGGFLVVALAPGALIHNMRVGPGYFFYGLR